MSDKLQILGTLDRGGVESMILRLVQNDFETDLCLEIPDKGAMEDEIISCGCMVHHLTKRSTSMFLHHKELYEIAKQYKSVHIHTQNSFLALLEVWTVKLAGVKKVIVHSHNTKDWRKQNILSWFAKPLLRHSCIPVACGKEAGKYLFGFEHAHIIPLPIDTDRFQFNQKIKEEERGKLQLHNTILFHAGNFREAKNHVFLIDLIKELEKLYPGKYTLLLAGDGELRTKIEEMAKGLPVVFLGSISDMERKMCAADAFLFPSLNEGLPTVVLEAQANGLSCLLSDRITGEVAKTNLVRFLPLDLYVWIHAIDNLISHNRLPYKKQIEETNSIEVSLKEMNRLYEN